MNQAEIKNKGIEFYFNSIPTDRRKLIRDLKGLDIDEI